MIILASLLQPAKNASLTWDTALSPSWKITWPSACVTLAASFFNDFKNISYAFLGILSSEFRLFDFLILWELWHHHDFLFCRRRYLSGWGRHLRVSRLWSFYHVDSGFHYSVLLINYRELIFLLLTIGACRVLARFSRTSEWLCDWIIKLRRAILCKIIFHCKYNIPNLRIKTKYFH